LERHGAFLGQLLSLVAQVVAELLAARWRRAGGLALLLGRLARSGGGGGSGRRSGSGRGGSAIAGRRRRGGLGLGLAGLLFFRLLGGRSLGRCGRSRRRVRRLGSGWFLGHDVSGLSQLMLRLAGAHSFTFRET